MQANATTHRLRPRMFSTSHSSNTSAVHPSDTNTSAHQLAYAVDTCTHLGNGYGTCVQVCAYAAESPTGQSAQLLAVRPATQHRPETLLELQYLLLVWVLEAEVFRQDCIHRAAFGPVGTDGHFKSLSHKFVQRGDVKADRVSWHANDTNSLAQTLNRRNFLQ